jgi:hypothetical protein
MFLALNNLFSGTPLKSHSLPEISSRLITPSHRLVDCTEQQDTFSMVATQPQALPDCIEGLFLPANMQQGTTQPIPMIRIEIVQGQSFAAQR